MYNDMHYANISFPVCFYYLYYIGSMCPVQKSILSIPAQYYKYP